MDNSCPNPPVGVPAMLKQSTDMIHDALTKSGRIKVFFTDKNREQAIFLLNAHKIVSKKTNPVLDWFADGETLLKFMELTEMEASPFNILGDAGIIDFSDTSKANFALMVKNMKKYLRRSIKQDNKPEKNQE